MQDQIVIKIKTTTNTFVLAQVTGSRRSQNNLVILFVTCAHISKPIYTYTYTYPKPIKANSNNLELTKTIQIYPKISTQGKG
jgi:hypothetical protein